MVSEKSRRGKGIFSFKVFLTNLCGVLFSRGDLFWDGESLFRGAETQCSKAKAAV